MLFWDASALVPLAIEEAGSDALREVLADDQGITVWWGSRVECVSAFRRRERQGHLAASVANQALEGLRALSGQWFEVSPGERVRTAAERILNVHALRAGDALQLAAALTWSGTERPAAGFVCLDERLREAASREGFTLAPESL